MNNELLYQIALTRIPQIGDVHARILLNKFGDASAIFKAPIRHLENTEGIGTVRANSIRKFKDFDFCEKEISFLEKYKIAPLFINDKGYPKKLLNCYDCPVLLFYKGTVDLNHSKMVAIVGTRHNSEYGRMVCEEMVAGLKDLNVVVVSGLAFGIDTIAHKSALRNEMATIGVLAHGLDQMYPNQNRTLAKQMTASGGLLCDFPSGTKPDKQNFPRRNRIVAGVSDCIVVVESGLSGGSLITAELGIDYNKDVFAFPGRVTDTKSLGCNFLIGNQKAELITGAEDLISKMNWQMNTQSKPAQQTMLFTELDENEKRIVRLLKQKDMGVDEIQVQSAFNSSTLAASLLSLEMKSCITSLPGKMYRLLADFAEV